MVISLNMPLRHSTSSHSVSSARSAQDTVPSGPLSGPIDTTRRKQRLLRIGSTSSVHGLPQDAHPANDESSSLLRPSARSASYYGTLPNPPSQKSSRIDVGFLRRHNPTSLRLHDVSASLPGTPILDSPVSFRGLSSSYFASQRPISAYDAPLAYQADSEDDQHARTNGIRVWYSSFSSIDWLHDAIKNSIRFSRLRRGKSIRSKVRLLLDKSMGWIIVTLVGFLTAVVAFLVVRAEQWLFDLKAGYCRTDWKQAKRFCCADELGALRPTHSFPVRIEETCEGWRTWAEVFGAESTTHTPGWRTEAVDYAAYTVLAVCFSPSITLAHKLKLALYSWYSQQYRAC